MEKNIQITENNLDQKLFSTYGIPYPKLKEACELLVIETLVDITNMSVDTVETYVGDIVDGMTFVENEFFRTIGDYVNVLMDYSQDLQKAST